MTVQSVWTRLGTTREADNSPFYAQCPSLDSDSSCRAARRLCTSKQRHRWRIDRPGRLASMSELRRGVRTDPRGAIGGPEVGRREGQEVRNGCLCATRRRGRPSRSVPAADETAIVGFGRRPCSTRGRREGRRRLAPMRRSQRRWGRDGTATRPAAQNAVTAKGAHRARSGMRSGDAPRRCRRDVAFVRRGGGREHQSFRLERRKRCPRLACGGRIKCPCALRNRRCHQSTVAAAG